MIEYNMAGVLHTKVEDNYREEYQLYFPHRKYQKYSLVEKMDVGEMVKAFKVEYEVELERLRKKAHWDENKQRYIQYKPPEGYIAKVVRHLYADLANSKNSNRKFLNACRFVKRCYDNLELMESEINNPRVKFRVSGGGRRTKAPEVRKALYDWFVNARGTLKGRLLKKQFILKAESLYKDWLQQHPEVKEKDKLKFGDHWMKSWQEEFNVSLREGKEFFAKSKYDRIEQTQDNLKNDSMDCENMKIEPQEVDDDSPDEGGFDGNSSADEKVGMLVSDADANMVLCESTSSYKNIAEYEESVTRITQEATINQDEAFLDAMHKVFEEYETTQQFIPFLNIMKTAYNEARRFVKKTKVS